LTRLNPDAVHSPRGLEQLERDAMKRMRLNSYAVLGPCDYLDVFTANDIETAARVSALIRTFGHAHGNLDSDGLGPIQGPRPHAAWVMVAIRCIRIGS
jgi:hypothetical protein